MTFAELSNKIATCYNSLPALVSTLREGFANVEGSSGSADIDYSSTEKKLGKWIDGSDYYGRVIDLNNLTVSPNQWNSTGVSASGIKQILKGSLIDAQNPAQSFACDIGVDNSLINVIPLFPGTSTRNMKYLIIQYTKTS